MIELINKYKKELEEQVKQLELNEQITKLFSYFETKEMFATLNITNYINLLKKVDLKDEDINTLINNIKYLQTFMNTLDEDDYQKYLNIIKEKINKLNSLIKEVSNEVRDELIELNKLLLSFNENNYIENIDTVFRVFEHFNVSFKDIKPYIMEIINHNKNVEIITPSNYINDFINQYEFSDEEKLILENYYKNNKVEWEQKYEFLSSIPEFKYIISNIDKNKKLFITLIVLSNLDIMNNIVNLSRERNIKLKKMLPNIFVSRNKKFKTNGTDSYYSLFEGSYEDFVSNLNFIPKEFDLSKVEPTYYIANSKLIRENYQIFVDYNIMIDVNSLECLTIDNLRDKLDTVLECGLYSYFKDYPRKLLEIKGDTFFYRLKYAKDNKLEYKRKHLNKELFEKDGYGISDDNKLDVYKVPLFNKDEFKSCRNINIENKINIPIIELLDERYLSEDKLTYKIGNFLISKPKVELLLNKYLMTIQDNKTNKTLIIGLIYSMLNGLLLNESETIWLINTLINNLKELLSNELTEEDYDEIVDMLFDEKILTKGGK